MPKTKFQELVFSLIMVLTMVYVMTVYNTALEIGLTYSVFKIALLGMWAEALAAFIAHRYIAGPLAKNMVHRWFTPGVDRPIIMTVAMAGCTVMFMAPMMTLFVSVLHHGLSPELPLLWLPKLLVNFPFALILQIFYVGPLARWGFGLVYKNTPAPISTASMAVWE
jgi:hypothetical protein